MKSFSKTFTYALFDKEFHIATALGKLTLSKCIIPKEALQVLMIAIEKTISVPTKKMVLQDYTAGYIVPIYIEDNVELPATTPIILVKAGDTTGFKAFINLTAFCTLEKDQFGVISNVKIDEKRLFALLQTASVYRRWTMNDAKVTQNNSLLKTGANIYAKLMYKVLDKEYAVGSSFSSIDPCYTALAYFFASYMADSKYARDIACSISTIVDKRAAKEYIGRVAIDSFDGFEKLIQLLKVSIPGLNKIDAMHVVGAYAHIWNGAAVPAIDFFPYFVHMIGSAYVGAAFMKDVLINSTIRTDGELFMSQLATALA